MVTKFNNKSEKLNKIVSFISGVLYEKQEATWNQRSSYTKRWILPHSWNDE